MGIFIGKKFDASLKKEMENRLDVLKKKDYIELLSLEPLNSEKTIIDHKRVIISVWKDSVNEEKVRIVIQSYRPIALGFGFMHACGFEITKNNKLADLRNEELYEFT
jgi:hypothetical protein